MEDTIFTVAQAAQYLQVCEKTVRRLINSGIITASRIGNRTIRIRKSDIDSYLSDHNNHSKGVAINE